MADYWPNATGDDAAFMNNLPKVVFSKTLPAAEWSGSRTARVDLGAEIADLKRESGGTVDGEGKSRGWLPTSRFGSRDVTDHVAGGHPSAPAG